MQKLTPTWSDRTLTNLTTSIKKNASQDAVRQVVARVYELIVLGLVCWFALATPILALDPELKAKALSLFGLIFTPEFLVSFPLVSVLKSITVLLAILWACGSESRAVFVATPISFVLLMSIAVCFGRGQNSFYAARPTSRSSAEMGIHADALLHHDQLHLFWHL